ncbi:MAG: thioredoxin-dependent thiol peroxidase [Saprospiraceae bacterium]|nr:thioredoxin-dependent thiol peroxidase [Candidatus Brachybacter algidus]
MAFTLKTGDKAPDFKLEDQDGKTIKLSDLAGKKSVIFFYPADMTPTCTIEACNLRDNHSIFQSKGYEVYGVSPDDAKSHQKFIAKHQLPYTLLSDPDHKMAIAYGVWDEKQLFGRKYMGIVRTTFILDEKGKIAEVITKVKSKDHASQILKL